MTKCWVNPHCVLDIKIEPRLVGDAERLVSTLARMSLDDPTFGYRKDPESGELIVMGTSEHELEAKLDVLKHVHGIELLLGAPRVAYRETVARTTEVDYTHKKQTGGTGQFARVKLRMEANEPGAGNEFGSEIIGGVVPKEYIPGVEKGVQSVWDSGVLIGFPMVDMKVTLFDGAYHVVDSSAIAFEIASRQAMREGCNKAGVKLLEPIMDVEVVTPRDCVSDVLRNLDSRRGRIRSQVVRDPEVVICVDVPLSHLFGYTSELASLTDGRARHTIRFSHYAEVPGGSGDNFPPAVGVRA